MKNIFFLALILLAASSLHAKKVKFSVDMSFEVLDSGGVHITGSFQDEAGFPGGDWQPNTTEMLQEGSTNIYSVLVDIPAFRLYEYKFINGSGTYGLEFVPVESRVDDIMNDNRWFYLDSLDNDTLDIGAIVFSGNAPQGYYLMRHYVDMQQQTVPATGVHVQGSYQAWNPATTILYSFDGKVYQYIAYIPTNAPTASFSYVNGNTSAEAESVPAACAVATNQRGITLTDHTLLPTVCFSSCTACATSGIADNLATSAYKLYPNPAKERCYLAASHARITKVEVIEIGGRLVLDFSAAETEVAIPTSALAQGLYWVRATDEYDNTVVMKMQVE